MVTVPCSSKHKKHCSTAHSELVRGYQLERHRQEVEFEGETGGYAGDAIHAKAQGRSLITFGDWLKAHRRVDSHDAVDIVR